MQISDDLMLGPVFTGTNGASNTAGPSPMELGVGPMGRVYIWDVVPLTLQTAGLAASQSPTGATSLTLTAGTGVTAITNDPSGVTRYTLDVPRVVTLTSASGTSNAGVTYTITGFDQYGQKMTETITGPAGSATVTSVKTYKYVISITQSATSTSITAGYGDVLGLPYRLPVRDYVVGANFNATAVALSAFTVADATTVSATTGDVRGRLTLPSAADGVKRVVVALALAGIASGPSATRVGALGLTQYSA
jgi:hypothetical protein